MKDKLIKTEWKHKIRVYAYQSKILELTNSNIPFLCQSGYRGYIGISRQLHPLKAKRLKLDKIGLSSLGFQMSSPLCKKGSPSICLPIVPSVGPSVHRSVCPSVMLLSKTRIFKFISSIIATAAKTALYQQSPL